MKLHYLGHSCFRIISETGSTIVCDPYQSDYVGLDMPAVRCDAVTVSHHHRDHDCTESILGGYAVIDEPIAFPADDIAVDSILTYHDDCKGAKRGKNIVFSFLVDGIKAVHMGDAGCYDAKVVEFAKNCDVLLIPVGGVYTVDARQAKRYAEDIQPKIIVPMHYAVDTLKFELGSLDEFLSLFSSQQVERKNGYCLELLDKPENDEIKVVTLNKYCE